MEAIRCELSDANFDRAVHGGLDDLPVLPEGGDLSIFVKKQATAKGEPAAVITFRAQQTDGKMVRVQTVTTLALLRTVFSIMKGWEEGGHL